MSDAVLMALFASLPATIAAISALIVVIRTARKVELVHVATNSMKDALVETTRQQALLEGHADGVADEKRAPGTGDEGPAVTKPKSKRKTT